MTGKQYKLLEACRAAQKDQIRKQLGGYHPWNTSELILAYYDHCKFFARDIKQDLYSSVVPVLNRLSKDGYITKLHHGSGSCAIYTFPPEEMVKLVDEVEAENA